MIPVLLQFAEAVVTIIGIVTLSNQTDQSQEILKQICLNFRTGMV